MNSRFGVSRTVFLFSTFVIKIPGIRYGHTYFLEGMLANWREWERYRKSCVRSRDHQYLCPVIWCSWFGLIQIMRRAETDNVDLPGIVKLFDKIGMSFDQSERNVGTLNDKPVIFDYGDPSFYLI